MKKLYKRALAVLLCLAAVAAAPATAFARDIPDGMLPGDIIPGVVRVVLNEAYDGELSELFTCLDIESSEDLWLTAIAASGKTVDQVSDKIRSKIGTEFRIELTEFTVAAAKNAKELLTEDDRVKKVYYEYVPDSYGITEDTSEVPEDLLSAAAEYFSEKYSTGVSASDVKLSYRYGWFGGCYLADLRADIIVIDDFYCKYIGGYCIHEYQMDDSMVIYHGGKVYSLSDAYEKGVVSDGDFALVADALNRRYGDYSRYRRSRGTVGYALTVLRAAVKLMGKITPLMVDYFDSDGDGAVTVSDALAELRIAAGLEPAPWLAC